MFRLFYGEFQEFVEGEWITCYKPLEEKKYREVNREYEKVAINRARARYGLKAIDWEEVDL